MKALFRNICLLEGLIVVLITGWSEVVEPEEEFRGNGINPVVVDDSRNGTSPIGGDDVVDDRRCGIKPNKNTQNRIGFRNVAMDKCRHSQVDKKRHTVIQE